MTLRNLYDRIKHIGDSLSSYLLLLIRLYWGYQFALTGFGKLSNLDQIAAYFQSLGIPFPLQNAFLAGCTEMTGGVLLFLGLFSRIATIPLFFLLMVAYVSADFDSIQILFRNFDPSQFFRRTPFLFTYAMVIIFCFGPGKFSLDYWLTGAYKNKKMP